MQKWLAKYFTPRRPDVQRLVVLALLAGFAGGIAGQLVVEVYFDIDQDIVVQSGPAPAPAPIPEVKRVKRFLGIEQDFSVRQAVERAQASLVGISKAVSPGSSELVGSGVVLTSDGWILTASAVMDTAGKATSVSVRTQDRSFAIKTIVIDPASGSAFLKIEAQSLPVAALGTSAEQLAGQLAVALQSQARVRVTSLESVNYRSSPLGTTETSERYPAGFLLANQLDKTYLGGPLLNLDGEVIGLVNGANSVIPADQFKLVVTSILRFGQVRRPYLGLSIQLSSQAETGKWAAKVVRPLTAASPAAQAGIRLDDLIVSVEGQAVSPELSLTDLVQQYQPGDSVALEVDRAGKRRSITVKLGELKK